MIVQTESVMLNVDNSPMRLFVARPKAEGHYPGIIFYSDIFQITPTMQRACIRLAGYGFVVAAPEIYHRIEAPGWAPAFDDAGREKGLANALNTDVAAIDADCRATLDYLAAHSSVAPGQLGAGGFCIGGHLAFRAALQPDVKATATFYPTGVQNGKLGRDADAGTLGRFREIKGQLLLVFGTKDPHIPSEGRTIIDQALKAAGTKYHTSLYEAEHAFMRDEGPRHDPEATDLAWAEMIALYRRTFVD
jgi:carboxymethylenebutenolidase